jgi:hypothetical protein
VGADETPIRTPRRWVHRGQSRRLEPDSGAWVHPLQILNRPYVVSATGERRPVEVHELGNLPIGSGDPGSPDFDSRTLVAKGNVVEVRLPWALLGYADPSSLMLL